MAEKYELAYHDYKAGMKQKEIAAKYDVSINTVKSWQQRKWKEMDAEGANEKVCTPKESMHTEKGEGISTKENEQSAESSQKGERKRGGNPNPQNQFSHRNNPKWTHGLRSKFLHQEQIEIIEAFEDATVADKLWIQLEIKFSAIIRMQKIMWVEDENDTSRAVTMEMSSAEGDTTAYKVAFAYEKYESYIKAFARASAEYRNLVDSFLKHAGQDDERRLKLQKMQLDIDKTNIEIEALKKNDGNQVTKVVFVDDISGDNDDN